MANKQLFIHYPVNMNIHVLSRGNIYVFDIRVLAQTLLRILHNQCFQWTTFLEMENSTNKNAY